MSSLILRNIQYHPVTGAVALLMEDERGFLLRPSHEDNLTARTPGGTGVWGNDEALAEAQAIVDAEFPTSGYLVALPDPVVAPDAGEPPVVP